MNIPSTRRFRPAAAALLIALFVTLAGPVHADVARIREKTIELEQKLNRHKFEVDSLVKKPDTERVYKDFSWLLNDSKIKEVDKEGASDELHHYLVRMVVESELAPFRDDLKELVQTKTVPYEAGEMLYGALVKKLATAADAGERRKIYSGMSPLFETLGVFYGEIFKRQNERYAQRGFADYAAYYAAREHVDLDAAGAAAGEFLTTTQAAYDSLFTLMAQNVLGVEARKVRYYDLPYLTGGAWLTGAFPGESREARLDAALAGLGIDPGAGMMTDLAPREGKTLGSTVHAVNVPGEVRVSLNPYGQLVDDDLLFAAAGAGNLFALSRQTEFENEYLLNEAAAATLGELVRSVLDEPAWLAANAQGGDLPTIMTFRAFRSLYDMRLLAAQTRFEIEAYRGAADPEKSFRDVMETATGVRLTASDGKIALSTVTDLRAAGRFQGALLAASVRRHLRETLGEDWFTGGKAGAVLTGLYAQGGALRPAGISEACGGAGEGGGAWMANLTRLLGSGVEGRQE